jgi:hypothetical protein
MKFCSADHNMPMVASYLTKITPTTPTAHLLLRHVYAPRREEGAETDTQFSSECPAHKN